jgi:hypothetical protein
LKIKTVPIYFWGYFFHGKSYLKKFGKEKFGLPTFFDEITPQNNSLD